jgi:hypothetical protein
VHDVGTAVRNVPRLSTVALVEAFAYFFLGLYKSKLEEIKYYQNKCTTARSAGDDWVIFKSKEADLAAGRRFA